MPPKSSSTLKQQIQTKKQSSKQNNQLSLNDDPSDSNSQLSFQKSSNSSYIQSDDSNDNEESQTNFEKFMKFFHSYNEQLQCYDILKLITNSFELSYTKIKDKQELQEPPLKFQSKNNIQYLIRYWRQKDKREGNKNIQKIQEVTCKQSIGKRKHQNEDINYKEPYSYKRQKRDEPLNKHVDRSLALTIIQDFYSFDNKQQNQILDKISDFLKEDLELLFNAVNKQVQANIKDACYFYENHQQKELLSLLQKLSPLVTILLNIEMSLTNINYTEESNTLSETLLPFLNIWNDYSFIKDQQHFILTRFLSSLVKHIQDNKTEVKQGFMLFLLKLDAQQAQEILLNENNKKAFSSALNYLGYSQKAITYFLQYPKNIIWNDVFNYLKNKEENSILDNLQIISKLKIQNDPGIQLKKLNNIFAQRRILVELLLKKEGIDLTIDTLIIILENLKMLESSSIKKCLDHEPNQWLKISQIMTNSENIFELKITQQQLDKLYFDFTQDIQNPISREVIQNISENISKECEYYQHNLYQCTIAAIIASLNEDFIIVNIPTGCGKTWIEALLGKYYCLQNKQITIVEPNDFLQTQTAEKIGSVDYRLRISKIDWIYQFMTQDEVIILNEYDEILTNQSYILSNNTIYGSWLLKGKKIISFSATSNPALEKFVNNTIIGPKIIKFPSQYELIHGQPNIQIGNIVTSQNFDLMIDSFKQDLRKFYEIKPVIIIIDEEQTNEIVHFLKIEKYKFLLGTSEQNLLDIRTWEYGVLVLRTYETRGVDTKFSKDSIVLIIGRVENYIQYQQFIGRGSRTLGFSEGILYFPSQENSNQILVKLKRQNFTKYQHLEFVIKMIQTGNQNQSMIQAISKSEKQGKKLQNLDDVKQFMGEKNYQQLIKKMIF